MNMRAPAERQRVRILQASTSEVYGDPEVHPQIESYWGRVNPIGMRSCCNEGKRCAETLFFGCHRQYALDIKVVRIFNPYGPRMYADNGRVVSNFIVQALRGDDVTLYGDGSQTRSLCYVDDLVEAMLVMMESPPSFTGPVNVGNAAELSMRDLAGRVVLLCGSPSRIVHQPLPPDDPKVRRPDIALARQALGWQPRVAPDEGLRRTIAYFRVVLDA